MPIRRYKRDPRDAATRRVDDEVRTLVERGDLLNVPPEVEQAAMDFVTSRQSERRRLAASLGIRLGLLRRAHGLSQEKVARVLRTSKSNMSRLERGREGGLTVERFLAVEDAIWSLAGRLTPESRVTSFIHIKSLDQFESVADCLETA